MPDNRENRGQRDRQRIDADELYEMNYIADKLGVSKEEVRNAIAEVGNNREKVEEYLRGKSKGRR
ncbi:MAG: DUF3606 domain-containing protein [Chitinophagaceae bacterium]|nr:DUF3606 domain-containing protein [Chitinophagaceae bacterium]